MDMNRTHKKSLLSLQSGFSLIEILVGLVIGLLVTLVITQVFATFEGQKRTTSGTADAQTNGSIALFNLQRDMQMAGYGLPLPMADKENSSLKCDPSPEYDPDADPSTDDSIKLFPVEIINGAGKGSDTVIARYSRTALGAVPVKIVANTPLNDIVVDNNLGCNDGDVAIINMGTSCMMTLVATTGVHGYGHSGASGDTTHIGLIPTTPAGSPLSNGAKLTCMGDWQEFRYEVVDNQLLRNGEPIVAEVIAMQAQYGISASADSNQVDEWVNAVSPWNAPTVAQRNRIKAVRIAVVARNGLREKEIVTTSCVTTKGTQNKGPCAWNDADYDAAPEIDLSVVDADWQYYRYRAFETIIPLRNMLWSKEAL
jgi:type IV pilus assembly protein PilW